MFKKIFYRYLRSLLIFSIIIVAVYVALQHFAAVLVSSNTPYLIIVFLMVTTISHYVITQADVGRMEYKPQPDASKEVRTKELMKIERRFIARYMLITIVKLLSFLSLLGLYAYFNPDDIIRFALNFLALYILYSLFEFIYIRKPLNWKS